MGPPALYIVGGVVVAAGAVIAFKELVYDPYILPRIEAFLMRHHRRIVAVEQVWADDEDAPLTSNAPREVEMVQVTSRAGSSAGHGLRQRTGQAHEDSADEDVGYISSARSRPRFGLQTPTDSLLVDITDTDPLPHHEESSSSHKQRSLPTQTGHTRHSTTPSLLRTPPAHLARPGAPVPPDPDADDDVVLSFVSPAQTTQSNIHDDAGIRMPMPRVPVRRLSGSEASSDMGVRSASESATSSRAMSPFVYDDAQAQAQGQAQHGPTFHLLSSSTHDRGLASSVSPFVLDQGARLSARSSPPTYASRVPSQLTMNVWPSNMATSPPHITSPPPPPLRTHSQTPSDAGWSDAGAPSTISEFDFGDEIERSRPVSRLSALASVASASDAEDERSLSEVRARLRAREREREYDVRSLSDGSEI